MSLTRQFKYQGEASGLSLKRKDEMQSQIGGVAELRKRPMRDGQNKCINLYATLGRV